MLVEEPLPGDPGEEAPGEPGEELDEEELEEGELEEGELEEGELGLEGELLGDEVLGDGMPAGGVLGELGGGELLLEEQPAIAKTIAATNVRQRAEAFIGSPPEITAEPATGASAGRRA